MLVFLSEPLLHSGTLITLTALIRSIRVNNLVDKYTFMLNCSSENFSGLVLVADDNAINRVLAKKLFSKWEIEADFAENGLIAYEMALQKDYDLILMDMHMPILDGLEATQKIRLLPENKYQTLPIIALTGSIFEMDLENLKQYGLTDYFLKPYTPEGLYNKIKPYLKSADRF